jgi:hypothetical protein
MKIQGKKRLAVSPVIATLLLIAIAVAAAIIVYAFVTGLIGGLTSGASSNLITATGSLAIPTGSGPGILIVSITNNAASPITGIIATYTGMKDTAFNNPCMGENPAGTLACGAEAGPAVCAAAAGSATAPVGFCNATPALISTLLPLPVSSETSATDGVTSSTASPLTTGTSYIISVTVYFANGATHAQLITVTGVI